MKYFINDLDRTIVTTAIGIFSKVPEIYTKLYPHITVAQQQTAREPQTKRQKPLTIWEEQLHQLNEKHSRLQPELLLPNKE